MVVMMVMLVLLMLKLLHLLFECIAVHCLLYEHAVELVPGRADKACVRVELLEQLACGENLALVCGVGAAHNDYIGILNLIVEELAEVAHIHAAFTGINYGDLCADNSALYLLHGTCNVGQLADT